MFNLYSKNLLSKQPFLLIFRIHIGHQILFHYLYPHRKHFLKERIKENSTSLVVRTDYRKLMKLMRSVLLCFYGLLFLSFSTKLEAQCGIFESNSPVFVQTSCNGTAEFCTILDFSDAPNFQFLLDGSPILSPLGCAFDTIRFYALNPIVTVGSFAPYFADNWCVNGDCHSTEFLYVSQLVDSMNVWDATGEWDYSFREQRILGGNPQNTYSELKLEVILTNTRIFSIYDQQFLPTRIAIELPLGLHLLEARNLEEQCVDSLVVNAVCTEPSRRNLQLERNRSRVVCLDTDDLLTNIEEIRNISTEPTHYTWQVVEDNCVQFNGRSEGEDVATMLVCDRFGICDTTVINIEVRSPIQRELYTALLKGDDAKFCLSESELVLPGSIEVFEAACENDVSVVASTYNDARFCLDYTALEIGQSTDCIRLCDNFGNCDTLTYNIRVVEPTYVYDTLLVGSGNGIYCLETTGFELASLQIEQACESTNSIFSFNSNSRCFTYASTEVVEESACVWLIDAQGNAAYVVLQVLVSTPIPSVRFDSIFVSQTTEICLDRSELPGQLRIFDNICEDENGAVEFFMTSDDCIELTGLELGGGRGCFVLCDNFGYCDTTYLNVQVVPYLLPPDAENDAVATTQTESVEIDIQANDNVLGGLQSLRITSPPSYGQAIISGEQIIYTPNEQNCIGSDSFEYEICNNTGCDIARVQIEIQCATVQIFTAMSPNGDGINDTFFVSNLSAYPNNNLKIFNRYGALVYEVEGYQNDWQGTWNGRVLPDGTYFFLLEVEVDNNMEVHRGYVELYR